MVEAFGPQGIGYPNEEVEITRLIRDRLGREKCLEPSERETVAYRIAEIMVAAKRMYSTSLPRLTNANGESSATMEEDLSGMSMTFLHLCDLLQDFRSAFALAHDQEPAPAYDSDGEDEDESWEP